MMKSRVVQIALLTLVIALLLHFRYMRDNDLSARKSRRQFSPREIENLRSEYAFQMQKYKAEQAKNKEQAERARESKPAVSVPSSEDLRQKAEWQKMARQIVSESREQSPKPSTPSPPHAPAPNAPPARAFETYITKENETLYTIAASRLGWRGRWREIQEMNPQISDPSTVPTGTTLRVPLGGPRAQ